MSDQCKCGDPVGHAKAVEDSVWRALHNAMMDTPERELYWRTKADKLERKFTTDHGRHYSLFLQDYITKADESF